MNMFVLKTLLPEVSTGTVFSGVMPFMWADVIRLAIPGRVSLDLALAAEHDAVNERQALGWLAIAAVVAIAWLALPFVTGLLIGALMAFTLQPVYDAPRAAHRAPIRRIAHDRGVPPRWSSWALSRAS